MGTIVLYLGRSDWHIFRDFVVFSVENFDTFSSAGIVSLFPDKVFSVRSLRPVKFCLTPRAYQTTSMAILIISADSAPLVP